MISSVIFLYVLCIVSSIVAYNTVDDDNNFAAVMVAAICGTFAVLGTVLLFIKYLP
jgi:nitrate reductase gamma subunit